MGDFDPLGIGFQRNLDRTGLFIQIYPNMPVGKYTFEVLIIINNERMRDGTNENVLSNIFTFSCS